MAPEDVSVRPRIRLAVNIPMGAEKSPPRVTREAPHLAFASQFVPAGFMRMTMAEA